MAAPAASPKKVELVVNCWNSCFLLAIVTAPVEAKSLSSFGKIINVRVVPSDKMRLMTPDAVP